MGTDINALANKPLRDYDLNHDGKIKGEEVSLFRADCENLFSQAYGRDSKQYKNLMTNLNQAEIKFIKSGDASVVPEADQKYLVSLPTSNKKKSLANSDVPMGFVAGLLIHETEHIQHFKKIQNVVDTTQNKKELRKAFFENKQGNGEMFAEIERMNFYKKIGLTLPPQNQTKIAYDEATKEVTADLSADKKTFFKQFNYSLFEKDVKSRYSSMEFDATSDPFGLKDLVGE